MKKVALPILIFILLGLGIFLWGIYGTQGRDSEVASPNATSTFLKDPEIADPVRLQIQKLGIDAAIQYVGVTANGDMETPKGITKWKDVAWYKYGPRPGEIGNAVIAGHVDNALGMKAVFANLKDLKEGDEINILSSSGKLLHFKITAIKTVPYESVNLDEVFGKTSGRHLNLITCSGTWVQAKRMYTDRLIVFTEFTGES